MRKPLLASVLFFLTALLPHAVPAAADGVTDPPTLYAVTATPTVGISELKAEGDPLSLTEVYSDNAVGYITENVLTAYGDGKLFFFQTRTNSNTGELWKLRFITYRNDDGAWSLDKAVELTPDASAYPHFMTYDPQTKTLYGLRNGASGCQLYTIDQTTGVMTLKLTLGNYYNMMATDKYGVTYATDYSGDLYKVDLADGSSQKIGSTGVYSDDVMAGVVEPESHDLYMNLSKYGNYTLYRLDTETGAGTKIGAYAAGTNVRGLAYKEPSASQADTQAPDVCTDLSVAYAAPGSLSATVSATAPSLAFDKTTALSGEMSLDFYLDGTTEPIATVTGIAPGQTAGIDYTFASAGQYKLRVVARNANGSGPARTVSTYAGFDTPCAPGNVSLTISPDGKYQLTWDAPLTGTHGGTIDSGAMRYAVRQYPGGSLVGETAETSLEGTVSSQAFAAFTFGVRAVCGELVSDEATSNTATFGDYAELPYYDDFTDSTTYALYTITDNNADGSTWEIGPANIGDKAAIYNGSAATTTADDYIILPPMRLVAGASYAVTFRTASFFNQDSGNHLDLLLLDASGDVSSPVKKLGTFENIPDYTESISEKTFTYDADADGTGRIALRCRSAARRRLYLFSIGVTASGIPDAPCGVTSLTATAGDKGAHTVTLSFDAPAVDMQGNALTRVSHVRIYRDDARTPLATLDDLTPGATYTYTDEDVDAGTHSYTLIAFTDKGNSEGESTSVFVGQDVPAAPVGLDVKEDGSDFLITWTAPQTSVNGGYVDYDNLKYAVYYQYGLMEGPSLYADEIKTCEVRVPKSYFDDYASGHQMLLNFIVMGETENGYGNPQYTDIIYGLRYTLPFGESFENGYTSSDPWTAAEVGGVWYSGWTGIAGTNSKKPMSEVDPVDGDNGMAMFYHNGLDGYEERLISPQVDITGAESPVITFSVYHYPTNSAGDNYVEVEVEYDGTRDFTSLDARVNLDGETGWQQHSVSLAGLSGNRFRIALHAKADRLTPIFLDHLSVFDNAGTGVSSLPVTGTRIYTLPRHIVVETTGDYVVYAASGAKVAQGKASGRATLSVAPGLYVVKTADSTKKCTVR